MNIPGDSKPTPHSLKTRYICGIVLCDETAHFRECVYCDQPEAHLCANHAVYFIIVLIIYLIPPGRWMDCPGKGGVLTDIDLCA